MAAIASRITRLLDSGVAASTFGPDNALLYAALGSGRVIAYDVETALEVRSWQLGTALTALSLSPGGDDLFAVGAAADGTGRLHRIDLAYTASTSPTAPSQRWSGRARSTMSRRWTIPTSSSAAANGCCSI